MPIFRRLRNLWRAIRRKPVGFVHLLIEGKIPLIIHRKSFVQRHLFPQPDYTLFDLGVDTERLVKNPKIKGLIVNLHDYEGGYATTQTIRDILLQWKQANKTVWVYANSYSFADYYLASVADRIYLTTGGTLDTMGVSFTVSFFKDYLESLGLQAQVAQVTPYKSAFNSFVYEEIPEEQRENLEWLRDTIFDTFVESVSNNRGKDIAAVQEMVDNSPLTDQIALQQGWVDGIVAPSGIADEIEKHLEQNAIVISYQDTLRRVAMPKPYKPNIAVIPVKGIIQDGKSRDDRIPMPLPLIGGSNTGDVSINEMIRDIRKEKSIKGAVLLVDSGGGSATASESMLKELEKLRQEMPVVVYFHDVAASGGYYVALKSDYILAQPLTITGSIGVVYAKVSTDRIYEDRNINRVTIQRGENANLYSSIGLWDDEQKKIVDRSLFRIYEIFKSHVSQSREIDPPEVDRISGGRVWMGKQAKDLQLIDDIGNFFDAILKVAELANIKRASVVLKKVEHDGIPPLSNPSTQVIDRIKKLTGKPLLLSPIFLDLD